MLRVTILECRQSAAKPGEAENESFSAKTGRFNDYNQDSLYKRDGIV